MQLDRDAAGAAEAFNSVPSIILPTQIELGNRLTIALGERRLLWAMLLDVVACLYKHRHTNDNSGRKLFHEAERWIRSSDAGWPFSFQAVCDVLGLDAQQVRVSLLKCVYALDPQSPQNQESRERCRLLGASSHRACHGRRPSFSRDRFH